MCTYIEFLRPVFPLKGQCLLITIGQHKRSLLPDGIVRKISPKIEHSPIHHHHAPKVYFQHGIRSLPYAPACIRPISMAIRNMQTINNISCGKHALISRFHVRRGMGIGPGIRPLIQRILRQIPVSACFETVTMMRLPTTKRLMVTMSLPVLLRIR